MIRGAHVWWYPSGFAVGDCENFGKFGPFWGKRAKNERAAKVALLRSFAQPVRGEVSDRWVRSSRRAETIIAHPPLPLRDAL